VVQAREGLGERKLLFLVLLVWSLVVGCALIWNCYTLFSSRRQVALSMARVFLIKS